MRKKSSGLVSEYLENISGKAIEQYKDIIRDSIRGKNGIYSLYKNNELVYVGLATDLLRRLDHHLKDRHKGEWDSFSVYITKTEKNLRDLESLTMRIAYPKNNRQKGKFVKADNLRNDFETAIDHYFEEEKATFFGPRSHKKQRPKFFKEREIDLIIVPARSEGFKNVFLGEKSWHAIRIKENKIKKLKYIAAYQVKPISAITHIAKVKKIESFKHTGKYIIYFNGKSRKLQKPIILGSGRPPQGPIYSNRELLRKAKNMNEL